MAENKTTATYKGFDVVIQQDNKKEAGEGFGFANDSELVKRISTILTTNDYYYLIKHDQDKQDDGSPKRVHYHIVFDLQSKHSKSKFLDALSKAIDQHTDSISIDELINVEGAVRYLLHLDDTEKHQYNDFEILTNDRRYQRYIKGQEAYLISCMKASHNMIEFTDLVGVKMADRYRGLAKDYIEANLKRDKTYFLYAKEKLSLIGFTLTDIRIKTDKERLNRIRELYDDFKQWLKVYID